MLDVAALRRMVQDLIFSSPDITRLRTATVTAVSGTTVTVNYRGTSVVCPFLAAYAPTVGDVVCLALTGPQPLILGRIVGT